jgi:hypothetical protein
MSQPPPHYPPTFYKKKSASPHTAEGEPQHQRSEATTTRSYSPQYAYDNRPPYRGGGGGPVQNMGYMRPYSQPTYGGGGSANRAYQQQQQYRGGSKFYSQQPRQNQGPPPQYMHEFEIPQMTYDMIPPRAPPPSPVVVVDTKRSREGSVDFENLRSAPPPPHPSINFQQQQLHAATQMSQNRSGDIDSLMDDDLANMNDFNDDAYSKSPDPEAGSNAIAIVPTSLLRMPGMTLASCQRTPDPTASPDATSATAKDAALKRIRRRHFNIVYWANNMKGVVERMTIEFKHLVAYAIFQREICPSTLRPHWQMYIEFFMPQDISFVKNQLFRDTTTHVEIRLMPRDVARAYCKKERTRAQGAQEEVGPFEFGTWREQGSGQKMEQVREAIAEGMDIADLAVDEPSIVLRNRVNLEWYHDKVQQRQARNTKREVTVRVFIGPTGSGKTHLAMEEALYYCKGDAGKVFILDSGGKDNALWFDGYQYGPVLIIDDYDSWIQLAFLLRLLDKYPCRLPVKGSTKYASYTEVFITSNKPLQQWTDSDGQFIDPKHMDALMRRIDWILYVPEQGKYNIIKAPPNTTFPLPRPHLPTTADLPSTGPPMPVPVVVPPPSLPMADDASALAALQN